MNSIIVRANAKINLSIDIVGKREDGYHLLKSIMQTVSLFDKITMNFEGEGVEAKCSLPFLPVDDRNLAVRAAKAFLEAADIKTGVSMYIKKVIPIGGGLGGGSTDAAAVLNALNRVYKDALPKEKLFEIALSCGADVPFCMQGGTCLCEGVGEVLTPLADMPDCYITIVKPAFSVSTKSVYQEFDINKITQRPHTDEMIKALEDSDLNALCGGMYNVLEPVVSAKHHRITKYRGILAEEGATGTLMSGSGSTVFGIFDSEEKAENARQRFKKMHIASYIAKPVSRIF